MAAGFVKFEWRIVSTEWDVYRDYGNGGKKMVYNSHKLQHII